jgi:hypothetical protein
VLPTITVGQSCGFIAAMCSASFFSPCFGSWSGTSGSADDR